MARKLGPYCPDCGADPPLKLLFWGLGKPFACKGCNARLMVPKYTGIGFTLIAITAFSRFRDAYDSAWWILALACGLLFVSGVFSWFAMKVRKVPPEKPVNREVPGSD